MFLGEIFNLQEQLFHEMSVLRHETSRLEFGIQRYLGEDMRGLKYEELVQLEHDLENSIAKVRNRQVLVCLIFIFFYLMFETFSKIKNGKK